MKNELTKKPEMTDFFSFKKKLTKMSNWLNM